MPKLILIRHGQSEWNEKDLFTGWVDVGLSELGEKEAEHCGELLRKFGTKIDVLYTSRLHRAIKTANIALERAGALHVDVKRSWRLNERHYGSLQGKNKTEVRNAHGEEKFLLWRRSYDVPPPPALTEDHQALASDPKYSDIDPESIPFSESLQLVKQRLIPYWQDNIRTDLCLGKNVIVVAHGNSLRALVKHLDNILDVDISKLNIPTAMPIVYDFDDLLNLRHPAHYLDPVNAANAILLVADQGKI